MSLAEIGGNRFDSVQKLLCVTAMRIVQLFLSLVYLVVCCACNHDLTGTGLFQKTNTCSANFQVENQSQRPLLITASITSNLIDAHCKSPESAQQSKTVTPGAQGFVHAEIQCENCPGDYTSRILYVDEIDTKSVQGSVWIGTAGRVSCTDVGCSPVSPQ